LTKQTDKNADKLRKGFRLISHPEEAAFFYNTKQKQQTELDAPAPIQTAFTDWDVSGDYEDVITHFYFAGDFPHDPIIWTAYKFGLSRHLEDSGLPEDYIKANYDRHHFYPAQLLGRLLDDEDGEDHANVTPLITALFVWKAVAADNDIIYMEEMEEMLPSAVLDIVYDLIDYKKGELRYDELSEESQNVIKAKHICDAHDAAQKCENWASAIDSKKMTIEDVEAHRETYQRLIVEKTLLPYANPLDALLEGELVRLKKNLDDGHKLVSKRDKKKHFKLLKPERK
jgi:hypothetical protein